jgi:uncharacterized membrane protein YtjA (UPF0391 family)
MLRVALTFLVIALTAGLFGFNLIEGASFRAARVLFFVFLCLAVIAFVADAFRGPHTTAMPT